MYTRFNRTFVFSVPSNLSINWLFEFHCAFYVFPDNKADVYIRDENTGQTRLLLKHPGDMTRLFLYVWHQCSIIALNFVVAQTDRDARASRITHLKKTGGLE